MSQPTLPTEIILTNPKRVLGKVELEGTPQPGAYLDLDGQTYTVLERRHRYHLRSGRYCLHKMAVYVQTAERPEEQSFVQGRWIIGDATCTYNAQSELVRCAVKPEGPCVGCRHYEPLQDECLSIGDQGPD